MLIGFGNFANFAPAHHDLGMLSLVISDRPGLEVWDKTDGCNHFLPIEFGYQWGMCTLMVGRQLEHFSNRVCEAAKHQVLSYGPKQRGLREKGPSKIMEFCYRICARFTKPITKAENQTPKYRYAVVFVLRADKDVPLDYELLSSPVCGDNTHKAADGPKTAGELFTRIRKEHFNVNTQVRERERQKQLLAMPEVRDSKATIKTDNEARVMAKNEAQLEEEVKYNPPPHPPPWHTASICGEAGK